MLILFEKCLKIISSTFKMCGDGSFQKFEAFACKVFSIYIYIYMQNIERVVVLDVNDLRKRRKDMQNMNHAKQRENFHVNTFVIASFLKHELYPIVKAHNFFDN